MKTTMNAFDCLATTTRIASTLAVAALSLGSAACSSSSSAPAGGGDAGGEGGSASGVTLSGTMTEFVVLAAPMPDAGPPAKVTPISGGTICVYKHPEIPCVTTASDGTYTVTGPPGSFSITAKAAGHIDTLYANYVVNALPGAHVTGTSTMATTALAQTFTTALGGTFPWGPGGAITFQANLVTDGGASSQLAGTTVSISPGVPAASGPFYTSNSGLPDKTITATTGAGWGGYVNVPVGTYQLAITNPTATCGYFASPTASTPSAVSFPVVADTLTEVGGTQCR
jgi:hypothetical protein